MNLLLTGAWADARNCISDLEKLGHTVVFMQHETDELPCDYAWVNGVVCNGLFLHHEIQKFKNLQYVQLTSAGYDRIPMNYIQEHNIAVYNAKGVYSIPMAEYAVCGVLQLYKQCVFFESRKKIHAWEKNRGLLELNKKTVCIIGCGGVGTECAKRFAAFDCVVIGVDKFPKEKSLYQKIFSVEEIKKAVFKADIIILTLPLDGFSRHLIGEEVLSVMKPGCVIVNISRGEIVDTEALVPHLQKKRLMAVLDVFEEEPLKEGSPLWDMENVIITPHNSFVGENNAERLWDVIFENLKSFEKTNR